MRNSAWTSTSCSSRRRSPVWATAAWDGWRPATWTRWPRWKSRPSATASATSSASSTRRSATAGRWRSPTSGCASAIPGRSAGRRSPIEVKFGGHTETVDRRRRPLPRALDSGAAWCKGVAYDTPILGYRDRTPATSCACGRRRRWSPSTSRPSTSATTTAPSRKRCVSENITKVLYPNDEPAVGQDAAPAAAVLLRLLLAAGHDPHPPAAANGRWTTFHEKFAVQLNDTHPAIAVAELMRLLVDEHQHGLGRRPGTSPARPSPTPITPCCPRRWRTGRCALFGQLLPRHLEIIYEINRRFLDEVRARVPRRRRPRARGCRSSTRAASATCAWPTWPRVGSHAVNGVAAAAHRAAEADGAARLLRAVAGEVQQQDQRRDARAASLALSNPPLAQLITEQHRRRLAAQTSTNSRKLEPFADDAGVPASSGAQVKLDEQAATWPRSSSSAPASTVDPESLFDIQVKRIHEYKRQHLNVLHIITLYQPAQARPRSRRRRRAPSSSAARPRPATSWPS